MATLRDGMATMQSAMTALFDRMDRFIRGLESNGHEKGYPVKVGRNVTEGS